MLGNVELNNWTVKCFASRLLPFDEQRKLCVKKEGCQKRVPKNPKGVKISEGCQKKFQKCPDFANSEEYQNGPYGRVQIREEFKKAISEESQNGNSRISDFRQSRKVQSERVSKIPIWIISESVRENPVSQIRKSSNPGGPQKRLSRRFLTLAKRRVPNGKDLKNVNPKRLQFRHFWTAPILAIWKGLRK